MSISLLPVLGFSALSVDVGLQQMADAQLQLACDAAAASAAGHIDGTEEGIYLGLRSGIAIAQQNTVYGDWSLDADQIVFGTVGDDKTFVAKRDYASSAADINAVRVEAGHSYNSIVAGVAFGATELGAHAISTVVVPAATGSASKVECWLPLVLPDCHFSEGPPGSNPDAMEFEMGRLNKGNIGWGFPTRNLNSRRLKNQAQRPCVYSDLEVGGEMYVEDKLRTSVLRTFGDIINARNRYASPTDGAADAFASWPPARDGLSANQKRDSMIKTSKYGNVVEGAIALVDLGDDCNNIKIENDKEKVEITGFTYGFVYDVRTRGRVKNMYVQVDFMNQYDIGTGTESDGNWNVMGSGSGGTPMFIE